MADDIEVLPKAKQTRIVYRKLLDCAEAYISQDAAITGTGLVAFFNENLHGSPAQKMAMLGLLGKVMAAELATPDKETSKKLDIPWLEPSRFAYKDPTRAAAVRALNADVVVDVESKQIT